MMPALPVGAAMAKTVAEVEFLSDDARLNTGVFDRAKGCAPPASGMRRPRVGWLSGDGLIVPSDPVSGNYIRGGWRPNGPTAGKAR